MITLALALLAQSGTVSYDAPMGTVRQVLEQVAKDSKLKIEHSGIAHIPILVQVKDVETKALLKRIADVTDSELTEIQGGFRLSRGPNRIQRANDEEAKDLAARLQVAIDEKKRSLGSLTDWSEKAVEERADKMATRIEGAIKGNETRAENYIDVTFGDTLDLPASLVLAKLMALPASTWVGTPGNVIRLSDKPNRYQRRLQTDLSSAYSQYADAHNRMLNMTQARLQNPRLTFGLDNRNLEAGDVNRTVVLANWVYPGSVGLSVLLVDRASNVAGKVSMSFSLGPAPAATKPFFEGDENEVKVPAPTVTLSKALLFEPQRSSNGSTSMMTNGLMINLGDSIRAPKQSDAIVNRLCADLDPFEDFLGLAMRTRARERNEQLVATFPSTLFDSALRLGSKDKVKYSEIGKALATEDMQVVEAEGWLTLRPRLTVLIDRDLADRVALKTLSQYLRKQGYARIEQLGAYITSRGGRLDRGEMDYYWLKAMNVVEASRLLESQDALRFYAALPENIRQQANFKGLAQGALGQLVNDRLTTYIGTTVILGPGTAISMGSEKPSNKLGRFDLSEALTFNAAEITLKQSQGDSMFVQRDNEGSGKFLTTDQLGVYRALAKKPQFAEFNIDLLPYDSYRPATVRNVEIQISIMEEPNKFNVLTVDRLHDNITSNEGPWNWASMPEAFKKKILDAEVKLGPEFGGG